MADWDMKVIKAIQDADLPGLKKALRGIDPYEDLQDTNPLHIAVVQMRRGDKTEDRKAILNYFMELPGAKRALNNPVQPLDMNAVDYAIELKIQPALEVFNEKKQMLTQYQREDVAEALGKSKKSSDLAPQNEEAIRTAAAALKNQGVSAVQQADNIGYAPGGGRGKIELS